MTKNHTISLADIPPQDTAVLERQVLADAIGGAMTMTDLCAIVKEDMFTGSDRQKIWRYLVDIYQEKGDVDLMDAYAMGEPVKKENIIAITPSSLFDTRKHAELLHTAASRRRAYFAALNLLQRSADAQVTEDELFAIIDKINEDVKEGYQPKGETSIDDAINTVGEDIQIRSDMIKRSEYFITPTGFPMLDDNILGGLHAGQLVILAARPGQGKTAVMLQMARSAAKAGFPTYIFSLEMTTEELATRYLVSTELVNPYAITRGEVDWKNEFEPAAASLSGLPIYINDSTYDLREIVSRITLGVQRRKCKIAFIDYLGYVRNDVDAKAPLYQKIAETTATLKRTAKTLGIPIVLLCQLNREAAKENRAPQLHDLRDSGNIEQDADLVLMLNRTDVQKVDLWVRKNRRGRAPIQINMDTNSTYTTFEERSIAFDFSIPSLEE